MSPSPLPQSDLGFPETQTHDGRPKWKEFSRSLSTQAEGSRSQHKRPPGGGCSGYFSDPDGYLWEVAWGSDWQLREDGSLVTD